MNFFKNLMIDYKFYLQSPNTANKIIGNDNNESDKAGQIENNVYKINENLNLLAQSINQNEGTSILDYLTQIYELNEYFKHSACIFNEKLFYFIFSSCIENESQEIVILTFKILNSLLSTEIPEFTEVMLSTDLPQLIINFFSSPNADIKNGSLSTICILSQLDPKASLAFLDPMLSSVSNEVVDIILRYIYNIILYFDTDRIKEIFQVIDFAIIESKNNKSIIESMKIISKGLKEEDYRGIFIEQYSSENWLDFFVQMINEKGESNQLIKYGYSILKKLVPTLSNEIIKSKKIFDLELISEQIDFYYDYKETFNQKYDISIVIEIFKFLIDLFDSHNSFISEIIVNYIKEEEEIKEDIMIKIFMIIHHSAFKIRDISSQLLCLIIMNESSDQIKSQSLNYTIESLFCILEYDPQKSEIVFDCFNRILNALLYETDNKIKFDFQNYFGANNASDVFHRLIEYDSKLEVKIIEICRAIDYEF